MPEMDFDDYLATIEHAAREEHKAPNAKSADDPAPCVAALREAWDVQKRAEDKAKWVERNHVLISMLFGDTQPVVFVAKILCDILGLDREVTPDDF